MASLLSGHFDLTKPASVPVRRLTSTIVITYPDFRPTLMPSRNCFRDGSFGSISGWIQNPDLGLVFVSSLAGSLSWTFATSSGFHSSVTFQIVRSSVKCHSTKKQECFKTRTAKKFVERPSFTFDWRSLCRLLGSVLLLTISSQKYL